MRDTHLAVWRISIVCQGSKFKLLKIRMVTLIMKPSGLRMAVELSGESRSISITYCINCGGGSAGWSCTDCILGMIRHVITRGVTVLMHTIRQSNLQSLTIQAAVGQWIRPRVRSRESKGHCDEYCTVHISTDSSFGFRSSCCP